MKLPDFKFEDKLWENGFPFVAGIDEVGRGCFAGPVVAGCVVFAEKTKLSLMQDTLAKAVIDDSKKLSAKQREVSAIWIKKHALSWGIGESSATTINRLGIVKATEKAFRKALTQANTRLNGRKIDFLLIDAFYIPYVKGIPKKNQMAIIKGDTKSFSVASASILAKVYRDHKMQRIGNRNQYKKYDWVSNKGYGAKNHLDALERYGMTFYHRKQFVETYLHHARSKQ